MKIDTINTDGKKNSIEVLDKIISSKINKKLINGECYKNYVLENEDELDIISTNKSVAVFQAHRSFVP